MISRQILLESVYSVCELLLGASVKREGSTAVSVGVKSYRADSGMIKGSFLQQEVRKQCLEGDAAVVEKENLYVVGG